MGDAMLDEETSVQFFADSTTYEKAAGELKRLTSLELLIYNPNYFGPISILNLVSGSRWGVLFLNLAIFALSLNLIFRVVSLNKKIFVILLIINPMTFSSLLSINKEVYSILAIALLIYGIRVRSFLALLACFLVSFLVRWQLSLFVVVYLGLISPLNPLRDRRFFTLLFFAIGVSALYSIFRPILFSNVSEVALVGAEEWAGTGLWGRLLDVQNSGGYFLIFPVKILQAMFGILVYIKNIIDPPEFYNYVVVMLHSLVMLFVLTYAVFNKRLRLRANIAYMAVVYLLVYGLTPIYAPRYFYPVFMLLCILVSERSIWQYNTLQLSGRGNRNGSASS